MIMETRQKDIFLKCLHKLRICFPLFYIEYGYRKFKKLWRHRYMYIFYIPRSKFYN